MGFLDRFHRLFDHDTTTADQTGTEPDQAGTEPDPGETAAASLPDSDATSDDPTARFHQLLQANTLLPPTTGAWWDHHGHDTGAWWDATRPAHQRTDETITPTSSSGTTTGMPDTGDAEAAAYVEDAERTAQQLLASITHEMTLANTPLDFQFPDTGYGPNDYADDHTGEAEDRLDQHLRDHPELEALPAWQPFYPSHADESDADNERPTHGDVDEF